ncbi:MAG TPA: acyclic terpene utilization AtuA family protein [Blastocatellia bacterium]|nr:acyclic terpene utilization AtuA family protein [Blastocatellia bacterium]
MGNTIRIANGQGFWGDSLEAPVQLVERGPIDYLTLDYLAEITMSIMQKQRARDPRAGYARDFVDVMKRVFPACVERGIKVVANAGGVNPQSCADAVADVARGLGLAGKVKIGIVAGDDIMPNLDDLLSQGIGLENMETGEPLSNIRDRVQSANVYFGARPIAEALEQGAQVIITGRCTDTGLALGPMIHEFKWAADDWDRLAAGTIAGHIIECGAQCTGGNCQVDWRSIPDYWDIGYPIVDAEPDGTFSVTKHSGTGGRITVAGITEQLMYEMGDPRNYITPDCIADFTTLRLEQAAPDTVRVSGIKGKPGTDSYKVSVSYSAGYKAAGALIYSWPDAYDKAKEADAVLRRRLDALGLRFDAIRSDFVGAGALHEGLAGTPSPDTPEVLLRVGVRSGNKAAIERFVKELAPLGLNGPPTVCGLHSGRPKVEEVVAYWPTLIPKSAVQPSIDVQTV